MSSSTRGQKSQPQKKPAPAAAMTTRATPKSAATATDSKHGSKAVSSTPELGRRIVKPPAKFDDDEFPSPHAARLAAKKTPSTTSTTKQTIVGKLPLAKTKPTIQHAGTTVVQKSATGQTIVTRPMAKKAAAVSTEGEKPVAPVAGTGEAAKKKPTGEAAASKLLGPSERVVVEGLENLRVVLNPMTSKEIQEASEGNGAKAVSRNTEAEKPKEDTAAAKKPTVAVAVRKPASPAQTPKAKVTQKASQSDTSDSETGVTVVTKPSQKTAKAPVEMSALDREAIIAKAMAIIKKDRPGGLASAAKPGPISVEKAYGQPKERKVLAASPSVNVMKTPAKATPKPKAEVSGSAAGKKFTAKKSIKGNILYERTESGEIVARLAQESDIKELAEARKAAAAAATLEESDDEKNWSPPKIYDCPITEGNVESVIDRTIASTASMRQLLCSFKDDLRRTGIGVAGSTGFESSDEQTQAAQLERRKDVAAKLAEAFSEYQNSIDAIAEFGRLPPLDFTSGNWNIAEVDSGSGRKKGAQSTGKKRGGFGGTRGRGMGRAVLKKRMRLSAGESSTEGLGTSDDSNSSWGDIPLSSPSPPPPPAPKARAPKPPKPPVEPEAIF